MAPRSAGQNVVTGASGQRVVTGIAAQAVGKGRSGERFDPAQHIPFRVAASAPAAPSSAMETPAAEVL